MLFYNDYTERNQDQKTAVFARGIKVPVWVAINETLAKEAVQRLNVIHATGQLYGADWTEPTMGAHGAQGVRRKGWSMDDLVGAAKNGELGRDAIRQAGTLLKAIAIIANGKVAR